MLTTGFGWLLAYEMKSGEVAPAFAGWPKEAGLPFDAGNSNLVMFAHPKCPCTRASLAELETILARSGGQISPVVCFCDPAGAPADWTDSELVRTARHIPGLRVVVDRKGIIAGKFGARTSGQVLLFNRLGQGVFSGGITGSRGHVGDNQGRELVLALATGALLEPGRTAVFGCALNDPACTEACAP